MGAGGLRGFEARRVRRLVRSSENVDSVLQPGRAHAAAAAGAGELELGEPLELDVEAAAHALEQEAVAKVTLDANTIMAVASLVTACGGVFKQMRDRRRDRRAARSEVTTVAKAAAKGRDHVAEVADALERTGSFEKLDLPHGGGQS